MPYIDFAAVKEAVSIEEAVRKLGLQTVKSANQLRGVCPTCKSGDPRALAITPNKGLYFCFSAQTGGDQIALAAHIKGISNKEAAEWLMGNGTVNSTNSTGTVSKNEATGFQPLDYLEHEHAAVEAVGFDPEVAKALGIGYAPKGILKGTVAVPVRLEDGSLAGYIGITEAKLPSRWHLPTTNVVKLKTA